MNWTDVTTHRQGETDRTPRVWEASAGRLRLVVHRHKDYPPDVWLFTCSPWFDCRELPSKAAPIAKQQAVALLRETLRAALQEIGE